MAGRALERGPGPAPAWPPAGDDFPVAGRQSASGPVPWLTTFTDLAALLLAFFVLQFAMSQLDATRWHALAGAFQGGSAILRLEPESALISQRPNEAPDWFQGQDLNYLATVFAEQLRADGLDDLIVLRREPGRLRVTLPFAVFADAPGGDAATLLSTRRAIAAVLTRMDNEMELVAYSSPSDARARRADWAGALGRATAAADSLAAMGLRHRLTISGRVVPPEREALRHLVDIVIYADKDEAP